MIRVWSTLFFLFYWPVAHALDTPPLPPQTPSEPAPDFSKYSPTEQPTPGGATNPLLVDEETAPVDKEQTSTTGWRALTPPEPIQKYSSPLEISRTKTQYFFMGQTEHGTSLFLYQWRGNRFYSLAPVREGYSLYPLSYDKTKKLLLFDVRAQAHEDAESAFGLPFLQQKKGAPLHLGLFQMRDQTWRFTKLPYLGWIESVSLLWILSPEEPAFHLTSLDQQQRRYVSPLHRREESLSQLNTFVWTYRGDSFLVWTDFCSKAGQNEKCLWSTAVPTPRAPLALPQVLAHLPVQPQRTHQWYLETYGDLMVLSLWQDGADPATQRWWKLIAQEKWKPLYQNRLRDPLAQTVIQSETKQKATIYSLVTTDGIKVQLKRSRLDLQSGKVIQEKQKHALDFPYQSALFPLGNKHLLVLSSTGMFEITPAVLF